MNPKHRWDQQVQFEKDRLERIYKVFDDFVNCDSYTYKKYYREIEEKWGWDHPREMAQIRAMCSTLRKPQSVKDLLKEMRKND